MQPMGRVLRACGPRLQALQLAGCGLMAAARPAAGTKEARQLLAALGACTGLTELDLGPSSAELVAWRKGAEACADEEAAAQLAAALRPLSQLRQLRLPLLSWQGLDRLFSALVHTPMTLVLMLNFATRQAAEAACVVEAHAPPATAASEPMAGVVRAAKAGHGARRTGHGASGRTLVLLTGVAAVDAACAELLRAAESELDSVISIDCPSTDAVGVAALAVAAVQASGAARERIVSIDLSGSRLDGATSLVAQLLVAVSPGLLTAKLAGCGIAAGG